jgi:2-(1,2-epoxy-1,2-dihydrophenyl)acetyl-CoA isomerase
MPDLIESHDDGVAILTLNRPERRNALSGEMSAMLLEALPRLAADSSIGCIVLTGAGGGFCAGGDVKGMAERGGGTSAGAGRSYEDSVQGLRAAMEVPRYLHDMAKPTIAALPGPAAGAGLSIALACDLRIAAAGVKMTTAFANVAFSGDYGGSYFLSRLVGTAKARELYFFGDAFTAETALELGIVNKVVAGDALMTETMAWARRLAHGPRVAIGHMKRNLNLAEEGRLAALLDQEALLMTRTGQTEDHREAAKAFVEKRKPVFVGR